MSSQAVHINLLPAPRLLALRRRRRIHAWVIPLLLYAAIVVLVWVVAGNANHVDPCSQQLADTTAKIEATKKALSTISERLIATRRQLEGARAVGKHPDWSALLRLLADAGGPEIVLEHCELSPRPAPPHPQNGKGKPEPAIPGEQGYTLRLSGIALTQLDAIRYADSLVQLKLFESVSNIATHPRDSVAPDAPGLHLISFELTATLTDTGAMRHATVAEPGGISK